MRFEEIPGLIALKEILVLSNKRNHFAHAQLFSGHEGGAALPLAIAFATYLLCEDKVFADACSIYHYKWKFLFPNLLTNQLT